MLIYYQKRRIYQKLYGIILIFYLEKSYRLKNIVSDLFDLAKSTSGDIPLELESLDIKKLIQQTLAVMEDEIEKSGLQIKTKLPENPINIFSDGKSFIEYFKI